MKCHPKNLVFSLRLCYRIRTNPITDGQIKLSYGLAGQGRWKSASGPVLWAANRRRPFLAAPCFIYGDSDHCADIRYATGLAIPDPFLYCDTGDERFVIVSALEVARARATANAGIEVLSFTDAKKRFGMRKAAVHNQILGISRTLDIWQWHVPENFPFGITRRTPYKMRFRAAKGSFFPERAIKSDAEIEKLAEAEQITEAGMQAALAVIAESTRKGNGLVWKGQAVTSELVKGEINSTIARHGGIAANTIVSSGWQASEPHNQGTGPILPGQPLIIDIFPRITASGYFGDLTRTVVKGKASPVVRDAYAAVQAARNAGIAMAKPGVNGQDIHRRMHEIFEEAGFETDAKAAIPYGFFHGTGHGVGLEIHEGPRVSAVDADLQEGQVVTIEPGLYYREWGGVRLEDLIVITADGHRNLTSIEDLLEFD
jgi:Xaa-Pro aminopeptidase